MRFNLICNLEIENNIGEKGKEDTL
jgi:hypothetical protein